MYAISSVVENSIKFPLGDILDVDYTGLAVKKLLEITDVLAVKQRWIKTGDAVANAKVEAVVDYNRCK